MTRIARLTSWEVVHSGLGGMLISSSFCFGIIVLFITLIVFIVDLLTQTFSELFLCASTVTPKWSIFLVIFAYFFFFVYFSLFRLMRSEEDDLISKKTYCFITLFIMATSICLSSVVFMPSPDHDVLIFKKDAADDFAFQLELNGEVGRTYRIFLNSSDQSPPEEFQEPDCTLVSVHDLCPTWGPLLNMNRAEFLRCLDSLDSSFTSKEVFDNIKTKVFRLRPLLPHEIHLLGGAGLTVLFVIFISTFVPTLWMIAYRRFIASDEWPDTQLLDFVERSRSSVPDLLRSLATDFLPTFLRSLVTDFPSTGEALE